MTIASDSKELIHARQRRRGNETNGTLRQRLSHDVDDIKDEDVDDAGIMDEGEDVDMHSISMLIIGQTNLR